MPSGVSQGEAEPPDAAGAASVKAILEKFGTALIRNLFAYSKNIMRRTQRRQHITAQIDERFDPGCGPGAFVVARAAGEMHDGTGGGERSGGVGGLALVDLVGGAEASEPGAGTLERRDHLVAARKAVIAERLDAAGLVEILGEGGAGREVREL